LGKLQRLPLLIKGGCVCVLQVTVVVPGRGELQLTVPVDVTGSDLLQMVMQQAEAAAAST
jgi:hypothetical protein